jgi:hypothetical protein
MFSSSRFGNELHEDFSLELSRAGFWQAWILPRPKKTGAGAGLHGISARLKNNSEQ